MIIAIKEHSKNGKQNISQIYNQLIKYGVSDNKIQLANFHRCEVETSESPRTLFLKSLAKNLYEKNIVGSVAECGVAFGDFAAKINEYFYDRKCYLLDTFTSFDERDFNNEEYDPAYFSKEILDFLSTASTELVLLKMPNRSNVNLIQGYIPETFTEISNDEKFCFVNLDMDLYAPTLAALKFFDGRISQGGVILVHDYFADGYFGVKKAVLEFEEKHNLIKLPIGDNSSIAIMLL